MFSKPLITYNSEIFKINENEIQKKPQREQRPQNTENRLPIEMSYLDYFNKSVLLSKYKLPELKQIAKYNKLKVTGNKPVLIERIHGKFKQSFKTQKIQSVYRGYITRKSFALRGDAYKNTKICVNENDFYTLEPLTEIPMEFFVSFKSNDGKFTFGCNIISLAHLIKTKKAIKNPYNREIISSTIIQNIIILYNLIKMIFSLPADAPIFTNMHHMLRIYNDENESIPHNMSRRNESLSRMYQIRYGNRNVNEDTRRVQPAQPSQTYLVENNTMVQERWQQLRVIRANPIYTRIQGLFMEIDLLGNYTNMSWFTSLGRREYIRLYRIMYEIWNYRGGLTSETKHKICIVADPFHEISRRNLDFYQIQMEVMQEICVKVMEYLVYCGFDDEYRKIGALHVLSALTVVSAPARMSMPWLYESIHY